MRCAWNELLSILPPNLRPDVDKYGRHTLQEIRLRLGKPIELRLSEGGRWLERIAGREDISFVVNTASQYSPWRAATAAMGYITAPGGHRIGLCGEVLVREGKMEGIRELTSLCIRVARDFPGIGKDAATGKGNLLILGPPGTGKTTLLRDLIRQLSDSGPGCVAVVDERGELFPIKADFPSGARTDVLTGCSKAQGVLIALKTMGPTCIAVDEITAQEDCQALLEAGWCGVRLLATAHAASKEDLWSRKVYRHLLDTGLFDSLIVLDHRKTWRWERMGI